MKRVIQCATIKRDDVRRRHSIPRIGNNKSMSYGTGEALPRHSKKS